MKIPELPVPLRQLLGSTVPDYFIDHLQELMQLQREEIVPMSVTQFDLRLFQEISGIRLDMSEMREEYRSALAGVKTETAELRGEVKADIAGVHHEISLQTKWILAAMATFTVPYPVLSQVIDFYPRDFLNPSSDNSKEESQKGRGTRKMAVMVYEKST